MCTAYRVPRLPGVRLPHAARFLGIVDQFSLSSASHAVSKLAALTQALIALGSVNSPG